MTEMKKLILNFSLYPLLSSKEDYYSGLVLVDNHICKECKEKDCLKGLFLKDLELNLCSKNLIYTKVSVGSESFIAHGMQNEYTSLSRLEKKKYQNGIYFSGLKALENWKIESNRRLSNTRSQLERQDSIFVHDIKKTYSALLRYVENYILKNCTNENIDKCLENADNDLIAIFKVVRHIQYQFNMIDYLSNPNSIKYGRLKQLHIYKTLHKIIYILQTVYQTKIKFQGRSQNELYLYESFSAIFFTLLDNAIKYSLDPKEVLVNIEDDGYNTVRIEISSYSPCICDNDKKLIFDKYYRGNTDKKGQGLGLFIAKQIADAHNTYIHIIVDKSKKSVIDGVEYCTNSFEVVLESLDDDEVEW